MQPNNRRAPIYYDFLPPQPPKRPLLSTWGKDKLAAGILLVILVAVWAIFFPPSGSSTDSPSSTISTSTDTSPAITPTPIAQPIKIATLGGTEKAFSAAYGTPVNSDVLTWQATIAGHHIQITAQELSDSDTQDDQSHIYVIDIQPSGGSEATWDAKAASVLVARFFPKDAQHIVDFKAPNGPDHIYVSDALAATFQPSAFLLINGNSTVPPGTFDWQCVRTASSGGIFTPPFNLCEIGIGQNYQQP